MYDLFYGFTKEPFRLSPDHHFAYQHRGYKKARAYMAYAFMRAEGFVMVTGRPGTGGREGRYRRCRRPRRQCSGVMPGIGRLWLLVPAVVSSRRHD